MNEEQVMELLEGPRREAERLRAARRQLESRLSRCRRMTAAYGGTRRGSASSGEENWAETADLVEEVRRRQAALASARRRVQALLAVMEGEKDGRRNAAVLEQRYLLGRSWPRVREELAAEGYAAGTERTLFNWHRTAIRQMKRAWDGFDAENTGDPVEESGHHRRCSEGCGFPASAGG